MTTKPPTAKRPPGRPRQIAGDGEVTTYNVRLNMEQRAKADAGGGGPWVRKLVEKAREPSATAKPIEFPPLEGETTKMNIRLSNELRQKVTRCGGGAWVRRLIDKAPPP